MSRIVAEARPASRREIRATAELVRRLAEKELNFRGAYFPIIELIEILLPKFDPEFEFHVLDAETMGGDHGLTIPSQHVIALREDVYDGACAGKGRDRSTAAHEVGHYFLHYDLALPRRLDEAKIPPYRSAEWQANCFAGELLVCARLVTPADTVLSISDRFGVSIQAANYQLSQLRKEGSV